LFLLLALLTRLHIYEPTNQSVLSKFLGHYRLSYQNMWFSCDRATLVFNCYSHNNTFCLWSRPIGFLCVLCIRRIRLYFLLVTSFAKQLSLQLNLFCTLAIQYNTIFV